ncbi:hypothetical protein C0Q70_10070 [Pomacea canaliculata]|uniref:Uncharacterized protein n=1 Tax=Pomacea canaliculata TaxID=400727 RepID=A0A2T7PBJ9_POMCA|nr:hypothetical protein C0Q70_10070 [Pomacea canaliculata]
MSEERGRPSHAVSQKWIVPLPRFYKPRTFSLLRVGCRPDQTEWRWMLPDTLALIGDDLEKEYIRHTGTGSNKL